ncbi:MAG: hypothetical protein ACR2PX_07105 [Endozoicomonas sp.]|uniref:hypothetical protein n=1 Tax=Endozoicomonas sp. TaxID=1892382 RepID=UPI003D9ACEF2
MKPSWKDSATRLFFGLLARTPQVIYSAIGLILSYGLRAKKSAIAKAALKKARLPVSEIRIKQILRKSARHHVDYLLALPVLNKVPTLPQFVWVNFIGLPAIPAQIETP